jgi:hypothetical protein
MYYNAINGKNVRLGDGLLNLGQLFGEIITIMSAVVLWKRFVGLPVRDMGFEKLRTGYKNLLFGLLFGALSMTLVFVVLNAFGSVQLSGSLGKPHMDYLCYGE